MVLDYETIKKIEDYVKTVPCDYEGYETRRKTAKELSKHPNLNEVKNMIEKLKPSSIKQRRQSEDYVVFS